ncbi:unnamed protein product [Prunus armeniaca]|uniref:GH18 domain-containing protein n=1 Tax=Prunus armeniaca TaxID=36596 RepID=A0A6J5Y416_PRUAR|nr:unnamed protein product [Prunus armeniaca]
MDYTCSGKTWIGYDNTQSITTKFSYASGKGLVGYFAWNVGLDFNWTLSQAGSFIRLGSLGTDNFSCQKIM